jgi:hypothetical protein
MANDFEIKIECFNFLSFLIKRGNSMASKGDEYETAMNTPEGSRVIELIKAREKEKKEIERKKLEIKNESKRLINNIKEKFGGGSADFFDDQFRNQTVGLVTSDEFKRRKLQAKTGVTLSDQPQQNQKETEEKYVAS